MRQGLCAASAVLVALPVFCTATARADEEPLLEKVDVFTARDGDYYHYRVPGIVVSPRGTVLAYCEARRQDGDWADIDIVLRRSEDGGRTWNKRQTLADGSGYTGPKNAASAGRGGAGEGRVTCNNVALIADRKSGAIHGLYCIEYARCYYIRSDDDGRTFTPPRDITPAFEAFRSDYDWRVLATGPGHGIQLSGEGLLVPVWLSLGTGGGGHHPSCVATIYSDDHGDTWQAGDIAADTGPVIKDPNETTAVQLSDGRVLLNVRNEAKALRRATLTSPDGATGWTKIELDDALYDPICMGSLVRLADGAAPHGNRILFSNADSRDFEGKSRAPRGRQNVSIKLSYDDCQSWPVSKSLEPGPSGYSDLAAAADGTAYCIYERGSNQPEKRGALDPAAITVAHFNLAWLTDGEDSDN